MWEPWFDLKCPYCKTPLVRGEDARYETLSEHCCGDERYSGTMRPTYICPNGKNEDHEYNQCNIFYDFEGSVYGRTSRHMKLCPALGSSYYDFDKYLAFRNKTKISFKFGKYKLDFYLKLRYDNGVAQFITLRLGYALWKDNILRKGSRY